MSSILTNQSAMVALQTLKSINTDLNKTQNSIATGKEVATAKDNAAIWSISKVMDSDATSFGAIEDGLGIGEATVAVAMSGAEKIVDVLTEMKELTVGATSETSDFAKIETELNAKYAQIDDIISASQFNGVNLLNADIDGAGSTSLTVLASLDRTGSAAPTVNNISVATADLETSIGGNTATVTDVATAATELGNIETRLSAAIDAVAAFGSSAKRIDDQSDFISKLKDAVKSGVGALVDADMEEASAKLSALQTQQQLGVQALSIANQAPQAILRLFQ
jgi:flagellin